MYVKFFCSAPDAIDPDSVRVQVHPEGVVIFWKKPEDMNGDFDNYLLKFNDKLPGKLIDLIDSNV